MVEARDSQSASNGPDTYAGLNAYDVYKQLQDDDMKRLSLSADSLRRRQDNDADGSLNSQELRLGLFQGKHSNDADKTFNKFLLQNYSVVAGLSRTYSDRAPVDGIHKHESGARD